MGFVSDWVNWLGEICPYKGKSHRYSEKRNVKHIFALAIYGYTCVAGGVHLSTKPPSTPVYPSVFVLLHLPCLKRVVVVSDIF